MKLIIFMGILVILLAINTLAKGLEITEIDVHVDYDEAYTYRLENRDRIDSNAVPIVNNSKLDVDILPGSTVTFTTRVENTFQGDKPAIRGVFATITIEDIDDGADLEEKSLDFDLEPGDDNRADIKFLIPFDVDAGTYNVIIEAEGEDRNETLYETELKLKLEVKKQSHDIRIAKVVLNPSIVDCNRKTKLTAQIVNAGSNAENQIVLEFKAPALGTNSFDKDISLKSSDEASEEEKTYAKTLNIEVPSFFKSGSYPVFINLYWKNFVLFDQKIADLVVRDCNPSVAQKIKDANNQSKEVVIKPTGDEKEQVQYEGPVTATREMPGSRLSLILPVLLGGFFITILIVLIILIIRFK